jgi:hypothetical protein
LIGKTSSLQAARISDLQNVFGKGVLISTDGLFNKYFILVKLLKKPIYFLAFFIKGLSIIVPREHSNTWLLVDL